MIVARPFLTCSRLAGFDDGEVVTTMMLTGLFLNVTLHDGFVIARIFPWRHENTGWENLWISVFVSVIPGDSP